MEILIKGAAWLQSSCEAMPSPTSRSVTRCRCGGQEWPSINVGLIRPGIPLLESVSDSGRRNTGIHTREGFHVVLPTQKVERHLRTTWCNKGPAQLCILDLHPHLLPATDMLPATDLPPALDPASYPGPALHWTPPCRGPCLSIDLTSIDLPCIACIDHIDLPLHWTCPSFRKQHNHVTCTDDVGLEKNSAWC